ncbi:hypothetical protein XENOCAPTIV_010221 [Xenoophorus captivus]|uniref:Solute carrier family 35 member B1 n=1 Tax=Xenoophorus captivus TaxID=1517983 RepID=A0ABV0RUD3_9TELE
MKVCHSLNDMTYFHGMEFKLMKTFLGTRGNYSGEKFTFARTLVFIQCIINGIFAKLLIQCFESSKVDHTKSWLYGLCSLSYLGAMVSSNSALQYVNYPTQVLGKSCKPIPGILEFVTYKMHNRQGVLCNLKLED